MPAHGPPGENLTDDDLQAEIELVGDLVVAATSSDGPLTQEEIDRLLGVTTEADEPGAARLRPRATRHAPLEAPGPEVPGPWAARMNARLCSVRPSASSIVYGHLLDDRSFPWVFASPRRTPASTTCSRRRRAISSTGRSELTKLLGVPQPSASRSPQRMRDLEHAADESTHAIMRKVNSSFITPFDREDIYALASNLDDCMDLMEAAVDLIVLYQIDELPAGVADQVEVLGRMAELTADAMPRLRSMKDLSEYWIEINRLENQADQLYRRLLAELFDGDLPTRSRAQAEGRRRRARGRRRRVRERRQHGREHRGQGVLTHRGLVRSAVVITLAMGFNYTNGFHDAANAIATSVSTRALTPRIALVMAAVANLVGAFFGTKVAQTVGSGIIDAPEGIDGPGSSAPRWSARSAGTC